METAGVAGWHPGSQCDFPSLGPGATPRLGSMEAVAVVGAALEPHRPVLPPQLSGWCPVWARSGQPPDATSASSTVKWNPSTRGAALRIKRDVAGERAGRASTQ